MSIPLRVLIVEDSEHDSLLLLHELRRGGYDPVHERVETADAMKAALDKQAWDLVVSDYSLPAFEAPAALEILKERGLDLPFIITSGTVGEATAVAALKAGAHDFFLKGDMPRLIPAVQRELREAEVRRARRQAEEDLRRSNQRLEILHALDREILAAPTTEAISRLGLQHALQQVPVAERGSVSLFDFAGGEEYVIVAITHGEVQYLDARYALTTPLSERIIALQKGEVHSIADARSPLDHPDSTRDYMRQLGYLGLVSVPLRMGETLIGAFNLVSAQAAAFSSQDLSIVSEITHQTAVGIQQARLREQVARHVAELEQLTADLRRSNRRLETLHTLDRAILMAQSAETIARLGLRHVLRQVTTALQGSISLFDFEANQERVLVFEGSTGSLKAGSTHSSAISRSERMNALRLGAVYTVEDLSAYPDILATMPPSLMAKGALSYWGVPLLAQGTLLGALNLLAESPNAFRPEESAIAREVADQLAVAIQQVRLREQIARHAAELEGRVQDRTAELNRIKERVEAILNSSPDAIILTSFDGVIQQVNPAFTGLFGYSSEEVFGKSLIDLTTGDFLWLITDALKAVVNQRQSRRVELTARQKAGSTFDADMVIAAVMEDSRLVGIVTNVRDISGRMEMERSLQHYAELVHDLYNNAPCGYHSLDKDGVFVEINDTELEWFGSAREDVVGKKKISDFMIPESVEIFKREFPAFIEQGWINDIEFTLRRKDGSTFPVAVNSTAVYDESGKYVMSRSTLFDITERRQAAENLQRALQKERELNELRTQFVSLTSHEFRTPLTAILTSSQLLMHYSERLGEEKRVAHLKKIETQVKTLINMLNDMLVLSRAESLRFEATMQPVDIAELCASVVDELQQATAANHQIVFTTSIAEIELFLDERLMRQAISNLLTNAIKYSPQADRVHLDLSRDEDWVVIRVKDQGIGIPEDELAHVFEAFHRAKNVGKIHGTGLGLVIVKQAVDAHNGTIQVESDAGHGTTFTIRLPLLTVEPKDAE
jgi:PAS domain S-box-containing protein